MGNRRISWEEKRGKEKIKEKRKEMKRLLILKDVLEVI